MDYNLLKELKEAGFPFRLATENDAEVVGGFDFDSQARVFRIPTLEELIEACGDKFIQIRKTHGAPRDMWLASSLEQDTNGLTPREAVARLWLYIALKKVLTAKHI